MSLKSIIKQAVISLVTSDATPYPQGQATYNGKPTNYTRLSPYGLISNPPKGSWLLLFSSMAQSAVKFGIASDMLGRIKGLKEGECGLYNTLTKSFILLLANGDCSADIKGNILANATGDIVATASGSIEATATTKIDLTAPVININGVSNFTGNVNITGILTINGLAFGSHKHSQGNDSNGDSQVDVGTPI